MNKQLKTLKKFLENPQALSYIEIENLLVTIGFEKIEAKGSHKKFKHPRLNINLIIPVHGNDCKSFYKNYAKKTLLKILHHHE